MARGGSKSLCRRWTDGSLADGSLADGSGAVAGAPGSGEAMWRGMMAEARTRSAASTSASSAGPSMLVRGVPPGAICERTPRIIRSTSPVSSC